MPNKRAFSLTILFFLILSAWSPSALAQAWVLPHHIEDSNTQVSFTVDSTWHTVHGRTSGITGVITQSNPRNPLSIVVDLSIPVGSFDTNGESRDERLREVMDQPHYPFVRFTSSRLSPSCHPLRVLENRKCSGTLEGTLSIRDIAHAIELPVELEVEGDQYKMTGTINLAWRDYHVEDPSILIAKLAPIVLVTYSIAIPKPPPR